MPPEWMWPFDDELEMWFEEVQARRENGSNNDDHDDAMPLEQNMLSPKRR